MTTYSPDLAGKLFDRQLSAYIAQAVSAFVDAEVKRRESSDSVRPPRVPSLLMGAIDYQSVKSKRYYHTQYLLAKERCDRLEAENSDLLIRNVDLQLENIKARQVAREATDIAQANSDMLEAVKYPIGKFN